MKVSRKTIQCIFNLSLAIFATATSTAAPMKFNAAAAEAASIQIIELPSRDWAVLEGSSLRLSLEGWSDAAGWTLFWDSDADFRLGASATFSGSYEDAVGSLLNAIYPTAPEILANLYRGNNVLHIATSVSVSSR